VNHAASSVPGRRRYGRHREKRWTVGEDDDLAVIHDIPLPRSGTDDQVITAVSEELNDAKSELD
jgi:hypothetical protein